MEVEPSAQITREEGLAVTIAVGFTVMVNVLGVPVQETFPLVNVGVTVIVAVMAWLVELVAVKLGIPVASPLLEAANPIAVLSLVQE